MAKIGVKSYALFLRPYSFFRGSVTCAVQIEVSKEVVGETLCVKASTYSHLGYCAAAGRCWRPPDRLVGVSSQWPHLCLAGTRTQRGGSTGPWPGASVVRNKGELAAWSLDDRSREDAYWILDSTQQYIWLSSLTVISLIVSTSKSPLTYYCCLRSRPIYPNVVLTNSN